MKANIDYSKKIAKNFHNIDYLKCEEFTAKNIEFLNKEREKHKTQNKVKVSEKIKILLQQEKDDVYNKALYILERINKKNEDYAFGLTSIEPLNSHLLSLVADESLLILAYKKVRKNNGAMTKAYDMSNENYNKLNAEQKSWVNETADYPDSINKGIFKKTSELIKKNKYPWGASKRIYFEKPGKKGSTRPFTIPPFMDKIVQEAIKMVMTVIYEPYFEKANCSFGFRPNKGVHDAIITLTNAKVKGLKFALEGDIKSAYDKVSRKILLKILGKKIKDRKFLKFIKKRLEYELYDTKEKKYVKTIEGLPQGGIDSPYLWNIYMMDFDEHIVKSLTELTEKLNVKLRGAQKNSKKNIISKEKDIIEKKRATIRSIKKWIKINKRNTNIIKDIEKIFNMTAKSLKEKGILDRLIYKMKEIKKILGIGSIKDIKIIKKNLIKYERKLISEGYKVPSRDSNKIRLRFVYTRYADNWIILTNIKLKMLGLIKDKISIFLMERLAATLSMDKTLLTNIKKQPAHFLGFEIKSYKGRKMRKYRKTIKGKKVTINAITAGERVFAVPDKQRQINLLYMKGYCKKNGESKEIGFLSSLDDFTIIERYNSVLRGLAAYYTEFIKNPRSNLSQWIYIIRYSCIKTLAQKHKSTVRKIFKKYSAATSKYAKSKEKTIEVVLKNIIDEEIYSKTWKLLTTNELIENALALKRKVLLTDRYWKLNEGNPVKYNDSDKANITNDNFLEKLSWINIRTRASFDMPCSICGSEENIEMYHIKHVRKNRYNLIDQKEVWTQAMSLRNRKQIPVCRNCHMELIHRGKYGGTKLSTFVPKIMYENRIITIESNLNKSKFKENYKKTLEERGWKKE